MGPFEPIFAIVWGRFDRKWGRFGLGPFLIGAAWTGNPETAIVVTRDFLE